MIKLRSAYPPAQRKAYNPLACAERIPQRIPRKTALFYWLVRSAYPQRIQVVFAVIGLQEGLGGAPYGIIF